MQSVETSTSPIFCAGVYIPCFSGLRAMLGDAFNYMI
jgi:hypothetical protein